MGRNQLKITFERCSLFSFFLSGLGFWSALGDWWFPAVTLIQCCRMQQCCGTLFLLIFDSLWALISFISLFSLLISDQSRGVRLVVGEIWSAPASPFFPLRLRDCTICCQWWTLLPRWIYFTVYFSLRVLNPVSAFLLLNVSSQSLYFVFHFNINFSFLLPAFVPFLSSCSNLFLWI